MIRSIFIAIFILLGSVYAQNLVPNPSFESYTVCPSSIGEIPVAYPWNVPFNSSPTSLISSDYFNVCSGNWGCSVPTNFAGSENPSTGNGYGGLYIFSAVPSILSNYKEYLEIKLMDTLTSCNTYNISFKYSVADKSIYFSEGLGMAISDTLIETRGWTNLISHPPAYEMRTIASQTNGWATCQFTYTAQGGEQYIVIGSFIENQLLNYSLNPNTNLSINGCYVYIDDVSITNSYSVLGNDTSICSGDSILLSINPNGATVLWSDGGTDTTLLVTHPGKYWVTKTLNGCTFSDTLEVVLKHVELELSGDTSLCNADSFLLTIPNFGGSVLWSTGSTDTSIYVLNTGTYWAGGMQDGCYVSDSVFIEFTTLDINLGADTIVCNQDLLVLNDTNKLTTYVWQNGSMDSSILVTNTGYYWLQGTKNGCIDSDTVYINRVVIPPFAQKDTLMCQSEPFMLGEQNTVYDYLWSTGSTNPQITIIDSGLYWLKVDSLHCSRTDSFYVKYSAVKAQLMEDSTICEGSYLVLTNDMKMPYYQWNNGSIDNELIVQEEGFYSLEVSDGVCVDTDSVFIKVEDCTCMIFFPNAFTPNGDGNNDDFGPKFRCDFRTYSLYIYDRWGGLVFETNDPNQRWTGLMNSEQTHNSIYAYVLLYQFMTGKNGKIVGKVTEVR